MIMKDWVFVGILVFIAFALIMALVFLFTGDVDKSLLWAILAVMALYYLTIKNSEVNNK